jgi:L-Ala-D/L-Glu epimerase
MIKVDGYRYEYKLDEPLSISFHTWYYRENVVVRLQYGGFFGLGEAVPFKGITGDSQSEVIEELNNLTYIDINPTAVSPNEFHKYLHKLNLKSATLYAALDFAYHDLRARIKGIPCYKLYSSGQHSVVNSVTVFLKDSIEETAREAKRIVTKHPHLKVMKIKLKGEGDIERCQAIRHVVDNKIKYVLDANQGFENPDTAVGVINRLISILGKVVLVEEPCPKGDLDKLKYVKDNISNTLIFADESAVDICDVKMIIKSKAAHGINIKLQKTGGIWPAKLIAEECDRAGLKVMVGAMLEGPIATAAGVHFAVSTDNVILTDLDMDLDMKPHTIGKIGFSNGMRQASELPGFGIEFDRHKMAKLTDEGILKFEKI